MFSRQTSSIVRSVLNAVLSATHADPLLQSGRNESHVEDNLARFLMTTWDQTVLSASSLWRASKSPHSRVLSIKI
jgi:hypothetical protein